MTTMQHLDTYGFYVWMTDILHLFEDLEGVVAEEVYDPYSQEYISFEPPLKITHILCEPEYLNDLALRCNQNDVFLENVAFDPVPLLVVTPGSKSTTTNWVHPLTIPAWVKYMVERTLNQQRHMIGVKVYVNGVEWFERTVETKVIDEWKIEWTP